MARRIVSGICNLCGKRVSKGAMWRHIQQCAPLHEEGSPGATQICPFSYDEDSFFCDDHSDDHDCEGPECHLPVADSPRMGVCAYAGPLR